METRSEFGQACVDYLRAMYGASDAELVEEYITEAEHQDGYAYWDNFKTTTEADEDFELYRDNVRDERMAPKHP